MNLFGERGSFALEWVPADSGEVDLLELGWAGVRLWVDGRPVWAGEDAASLWWTWLEFVEHLARAWVFLRWEDTMPFGIAESNPRTLRTSRALRSVTGRSPDEVESEVHAWDRRHNLAAGVAGIWLPPVWLIPSGRLVRICSRGADVVVELDPVLAALASFGDHVLSSLPSREPSPRVTQAFAWWSSREGTWETRWRLQTGLQEAVAARVLPAAFARTGATDEPAPDTVMTCPILAAARYSGMLAEDELRAVLEAIAGVPHTETQHLDQLTDEAEALQRTFLGEPYFRQGYNAARWLRARLSNDGMPLDPDRLLALWGVPVEMLPPVDPALDAIAVWGQNHGPAILINPVGMHQHSTGGRRATLAHEIAHLLLDRTTHLPAAEVLGGRTPEHVEKRARAFAAEFLMPRQAAAERLLDPDNRRTTLESLPHEYDVSRELAGWQVRNGPAYKYLASAEKRLVNAWCRM
jgi:hypothetical protein